MFASKLTDDEVEVISIIEDFVRNKHQESDSHDYSHVIKVTEHAIEIGKIIKEKADPFILICGALLHDIGKTNLLFSSMHGILGSALAEEFLNALESNYSFIKKSRNAICRIVARHTPTTMIPPETIEEKIVYDADTLDRLGIIGVLRGFIRKQGSIEEILESKMKSRQQDYDKLNYEESRIIGKKLNDETLLFIEGIQKSLKLRKNSVRELDLDLVT